MQSIPEDHGALQAPINNSEGFHSIIYTKLSDTGILLVGEMDCLDLKTSNAPAPFCYVELKTTKLHPALDLSHDQTYLWSVNVSRSAAGKIFNIPLHDISTVEWNSIYVLISLLICSGPKLLKFWAQSAISGVPKLCIGFRTEDGIVKKTEEVATEKLPTFAKVSFIMAFLLNHWWGKKTKTNFIHDFVITVCSCVRH